MSGIKHNTFEIAARMQARGPAVEREAQAALDDESNKLVHGVRQRARKFSNVLLNSVHVDTPEPFTRVIGVGAAHGIYQELGIKPGGKGLPRFFDPASAPVVAWLQAKLGGQPRARSKARQSYELELRDRYEGLALHIRHKGMKASPFVRPTFQAMRDQVSSALMLAVRRGMAADSSSGGVA